MVFNQVGPKNHDTIGILQVVQAAIKVDRFVD
jgi:hypothetical protein